MMRMSRMFSQTLRETPSDAETAGHALLARAGFIRQHAAGIFSYLPLARRSLSKIEAILREEINAIGGQEIAMPVVNPAGLWQETGRWHRIGPELGRFQDRGGRDMALAMTHEEAVTDLVRREIRSYRQLPQLVYHIQTKWRDDPRPRAGLIRVREFTMKDSYSLDADWEGLDRQYRNHYRAYFTIFGRCALPVIAVRSDVGMMGGKMAHEFMYLTPVGEDTLLLCARCGYSANRQVALFRKDPAPEEAPAALEKVSTPGISTIEALAAFLGIPKSKTAKAVFLVGTLGRAGEEPGEEKLIFAVVRGDMSLNEAKLANALAAWDLRPAREEEIRAAGGVPGYASPIGVRGALVVVDDAVAASANLVAGANEEGYHLRGVNYGRDYPADRVLDIALAEEGFPCPRCGEPMGQARGVEVGNIFKLGTRYSEAMQATFADPSGLEKPVIMGSYGIGSGRLLACIAEEHHDENGLAWPITVAPYPVHLVLLNKAGEEAQRIGGTLEAAGIEVLFDDRHESAGVKFIDADLIGLPIRLTVSERSLAQGGVELKLRREKEKRIVPSAGVLPAVRAAIERLEADIAGRIVETPFKE